MIDTETKRGFARWRPQFSIRLMLLATAIVAIVLPIGLRSYRRRAALERAQHFLQAVQTGDYAETNRLLNASPHLAHGLEGDGISCSHTPLQMALVFGRSPKVVARILEEHPDIDEPAIDGKTALHVAVERQMVSEVARLLELGANPNIHDQGGMTPLHIAVQADRTAQMAGMLLDHDADPNMAVSGDSYYSEKTALHLAAKWGRTLNAERLLEHGARVDFRDADGRTALHLAMANDRSDVVKLLLNHGADLTARDHAGRIPGELGDGSNSQAAAVFWWEQIVRLHDEGDVSRLNALLDAVPQVLSFRTRYDPATMLHRAVYQRRLDVLDYLLGRVLDTEVRGVVGQTPLHTACDGYVPCEFAEHLIAAGAKIEAENQFGQTPLHSAAKGHHHEVLEILIAEGADLDAVDQSGTTVMDASFEQSFHRDRGLKTLELLRQAGHKPTVMYAAATSDVNLLGELTGGNLDLLDRGYTRNGVRPLHAAVYGRQPEVIRWLVEQGVTCDPVLSQVPSATPVGTPLMIALGYNMMDVAELLLELGANVNGRGRTGMAPVHAAIEWDRDPAVLELLLGHGADVTLEYQGKTAIQCALDSKSKYRERYLELLGVEENGE